MSLCHKRHPPKPSEKTAILYSFDKAGDYISPRRPLINGLGENVKTIYRLEKNKIVKTECVIFEYPHNDSDGYEISENNSHFETKEAALNEFVNRKYNIVKLNAQNLIDKREMLAEAKNKLNKSTLEYINAKSELRKLTKIKG